MRLSNMIRVTPAAGRLVRDIRGAEVPEGGGDYPDGCYWRRRERDGDVAIGPASSTGKSDSSKAKDKS